MSRPPGAIEVDLAGPGLRRLLDGVELDADARTAALARVPGAPRELGGPLDPAAALAGPAGIAISPEGDVFVADPAGHRVLRIGACEADGTPLACVTGPGREPGRVDTPRGVACGPPHRLLVADSGNDRVLGFHLPSLQLVVVSEPVAEPRDLATDREGGIYVVAHGTGRLEKLDRDGRLEPALGEAIAAQPTVPALPVGVAIALIDGAERLVVVEDGPGGRLLVYALDGTFDAARTSAWATGVAEALAGSAAGAVAVGDGRLHVAEASGGILTFTTDGRFLGRTPGHAAGATSLALDAAGRLLLRGRDGGVVRLERPSTVATGTLRIGPVRLDGDDAPVAWQRVSVAASLPAGAHVQLFTLTADTTGDPPPLPPAAPVADAEPTPPGRWRAAPPDALDLLAGHAPATVLWLGARLRAGEGGSPVLTRVRIAHDDPGWLGLLPAVYARDDDARALLTQLLALVQSGLDDESALLDALPELLGAASAPDADGARWLDALGGWLAIELDERWAPETRRAAVAAAFALHGRRGTADGLRELAQLTLGLDVRVREPGAAAALWALGGAGSALGATTMLAGAPAQGAVLGSTATLGSSDLDGDSGALLGELANRFCVDVLAADLHRPGLADELRALVDRERPAEAVGHVRVVGARARVGVQARLGIDAIVAGGAGALRLDGPGALGTDSALPHRPPGAGARVGDPLRVGLTTRVT